MLRALIGTGVLLMAVGFGAAGWQYWQSMPKSQPAAAEPAPAAPTTPRLQTWLISPTGGLVAQDDVRAYLVQDRFVPSRILTVTRQASLSSLLAEGEKLPDPAFLQVLADIRAPKVATGLCGVMTQTVAQDCAVNSARVVPDSVDPAAGTALFQLELVYRLKDDAAELPDLAAHVLQGDVVQLTLDPGAEGTASADALLQATLAAVASACSADGIGTACRPLRITLDWGPGRPVFARAQIGWLEPLPKGMSVAPPLDTGG